MGEEAIRFTVLRIMGGVYGGEGKRQDILESILEFSLHRTPPLPKAL